MAETVLVLSVLLQLVAALCALRLVRITGRRRAWLLIAAAIVLMAVRRIVTLERALTDGVRPDLAAESVALLISIAMLWGIAEVRPVFVSITRDREALRKWEHVFWHADWGVATTTRDGTTFESVNPAFARMHGYEVDELVGRPLATVYAPGDRDLVATNLARVRDEGPYRVEAEHVRRDGSVFPVVKAVTAVCDDEGEVLYFAAHVEDITERREAEETLRERETRLSVLADQVPASLWTLDRDLVITSSSGSALRELGLRPGELVGKRLTDYLGTDDPDFLPLRMHRRALDGESVSYDFEWRERVFETHIEPLRGGNGEITGAIGIALDVTPRKRAEDELRRSHEQLRNLAARLQEIREQERTAVAREIHDELGQALTGLRLELVMCRDQLAGELRERACSMIALVDGTIETTRRLSASLRPALLDELGLEAALEALVREFHERVSGCACSLDLEVGELGLDRERDTAVYRIVQEALTNVVRHAQATRVEVRLRARDGDLLVEVEDDGRGITEEEIASIRSFGLIGMRERAHLIGGDVSFHRGDEGGTVVRLRLPVPGDPGGET